MKYDNDTVAEALEGNRESIEGSNRLENLIEIFEALDIERDYDELADRNHASLVKADDLEDIALRAIELAVTDLEEAGNPEESEDTENEEADNDEEEEAESEADSDGESNEGDEEEAQIPYEVARERLNDKYTRDELRSGPASEHDIDGRWDMSKGDLLDAVLAEMENVAEPDEDVEAADGGEVEAREA